MYCSCCSVFISAVSLFLFFNLYNAFLWNWNVYTFINALYLGHLERSKMNATTVFWRHIVLLYCTASICSNKLCKDGSLKVGDRLFLSFRDFFYCMCDENSDSVYVKIKFIWNYFTGSGNERCLNARKTEIWKLKMYVVWWKNVWVLPFCWTGNFFYLKYELRECFCLRFTFSFAVFCFIQLQVKMISYFTSTQMLIFLVYLKRGWKINTWTRFNI